MELYKLNLSIERLRLARFPTTQRRRMYLPLTRVTTNVLEISIIFNANLPIREEARLAEDFEKARDAFNQWLQFVTDSIQEQDELEPEGAAPEFRYRQRADVVLSAMSRLDADLLEFMHIQKPNLVEDSVSLAAERLYDLGRRLRSRFNGLSSDNARIAGTDLFAQYSWAKP